MHTYVKFILEYIKDIRIQLLIGVICFFIISLYLTTIPGSIYIALWILIGGFTLYFIYLTFPDVWNYVFWLMGIFFINFLAVLCLLQTIYTSHPLFYAIGIFLELVTLGIDVMLILRIKRIRDDISGVTDRPVGMELEHEAAYIPLGLWSLAVFLFWFGSNLSILYWYNWSIGSWGSEPYLIIDILLIILVIYILWHPQINFDWGVESTVSPLQPLKIGTGIISKSQRLIPQIRKTVSVSGKPSKKCPICGAKIMSERRLCSNCGKSRIFTWCKINEGYIVTCPHCKSRTSYGKDLCIQCGKPINRMVRCVCGTENEIRDWELMKTAS